MSVNERTVFFPVEAAKQIRNQDRNHDQGQDQHQDQHQDQDRDPKSTSTLRATDKACPELAEGSVRPTRACAGAFAVNEWRDRCGWVTRGEL